MSTTNKKKPIVATTDNVHNEIANTASSLPMDRVTYEQFQESLQRKLFHYLSTPSSFKNDCRQSLLADPRQFLREIAIGLSFLCSLSQVQELSECILEYLGSVPSNEVDNIILESALQVLQQCNRQLVSETSLIDSFKSFLCLIQNSTILSAIYSRISNIFPFFPPTIIDELFSDAWNRSFNGKNNGINALSIAIIKGIADALSALSPTVVHNLDVWIDRALQLLSMSNSLTQTIPILCFLLHPHVVLYSYASINRTTIMEHLQIHLRIGHFQIVSPTLMISNGGNHPMKRFKSSPSEHINDSLLLDLLHLITHRKCIWDRFREAFLLCSSTRTNIVPSLSIRLFFAILFYRIDPKSSLASLYNCYDDKNILEKVLKEQILSIFLCNNYSSIMSVSHMTLLAKDCARHGIIQVAYSIYNFLLLLSPLNNNPAQMTESIIEELVSLALAHSQHCGKTDTNNWPLQMLHQLFSHYGNSGAVTQILLNNHHCYSLINHLKILFDHLNNMSIKDVRSYYSLMISLATAITISSSPSSLSSLWNELLIIFRKQCSSLDCQVRLYGAISILALTEIVILSGEDKVDISETNLKGREENDKFYLMMNDEASCSQAPPSSQKHHQYNAVDDDNNTNNGGKSQQLSKVPLWMVDVIIELMDNLCSVCLALTEPINNVGQQQSLQGILILLYIIQQLTIIIPKKTHYNATMALTLTLIEKLNGKISGIFDKLFIRELGPLQLLLKRHLHSTMTQNEDECVKGDSIRILYGLDEDGLIGINLGMIPNSPPFIGLLLPFMFGLIQKMERFLNEEEVLDNIDSLLDAPLILSLTTTTTTTTLRLVDRWAITNWFRMLINTFIPPSSINNVVIVDNDGKGRSDLREKCFQRMELLATTLCNDDDNNSDERKKLGMEIIDSIKKGNLKTLISLQNGMTINCQSYSFSIVKMEEYFPSETRDFLRDISNISKEKGKSPFISDGNNNNPNISMVTSALFGKLNLDLMVPLHSMVYVNFLTSMEGSEAVKEYLLDSLEEDLKTMNEIDELNSIANALWRTFNRSFPNPSSNIQTNFIHHQTKYFRCFLILLSRLQSDSPINEQYTHLLFTWLNSQTNSQMDNFMEYLTLSDLDLTITTIMNQNKKIKLSKAVIDVIFNSLLDIIIIKREAGTDDSSNAIELLLNKFFIMMPIMTIDQRQEYIEQIRTRWRESIDAEPPNILLVAMLHQLLLRAISLPISPSSFPTLGSHNDMIATITWSLRLFEELVQCTRNNPIPLFEALLEGTLRYGKTFLENSVIKHYLPILTETILVETSNNQEKSIGGTNNATLKAMDAIKLLQQSTRSLQIICNHIKAINIDVSNENIGRRIVSDKKQPHYGTTTKLIIQNTLLPQMKRTLESLLFAFKHSLGEAGLLEAFWMGNLKNKQLDGTECGNNFIMLPSQKSITSDDDDDDEIDDTINDLSSND